MPHLQRQYGQIGLAPASTSLDPDQAQRRIFARPAVQRTGSIPHSIGCRKLTAPLMNFPISFSSGRMGRPLLKPEQKLKATVIRLQKETLDRARRSSASGGWLHSSVKPLSTNSSDENAKTNSVMMSDSAVKEIDRCVGSSPDLGP